MHQDDSPPDQKKIVTDDTGMLTDESTSVILSAELKDQVAANRLTAKMKLANKQTRGLVRDLGLSWFAALESEFSKPYFQQVHVQTVMYDTVYQIQHNLCIQYCVCLPSLY